MTAHLGMKMTTLRQRLGYCVGISAAVPTFVAEEIGLEVQRRRARGARGHAGKGPVAGDVVREVLISWARAVRKARGGRVTMPNRHSTHSSMISRG